MSQCDWGSGSRDSGPQGERVYLGIDFGTSGARAIAINQSRGIVAQVQQVYASAVTLPESWRKTLWSLLADLPVQVRQRCQAIAVDGTSGTVLLCDRTGEAVVAPLLYHQAVTAVDLPSAVPGPARSMTSSLAKALWWQQNLDPASLERAHTLMHQADWVAWLLHGQLGLSDYHNALKLGYDVQALQYADGLGAWPVVDWFPAVMTPGQAVKSLRPEIAAQFGLPATCQVKAGTTDSIAAFLASGARLPGEAVTSLGSTLVLKLLSTHPVEDVNAGIYSHRLGDLWLAGGASNTGGAVLRHYFSDVELVSLSAQIDPAQSTGLEYYPLLRPGERFPVNDPAYLPRLTPIPENRLLFLQGLLEGMARIEALGYQKLMALGSTPLDYVYTAGGGAANVAWADLRRRALGIDVGISPNADAAFGAALLALE
ncbi:MAG: FGGY-family carbohydrate kinase [Cyanobacteria bacterium J06632_22]